MKLWLDDIVPAPKGWILFKTAPEMIKFLQNNKNRVQEISLDHDLGIGYGCGTGYDILTWIELQVNIDDNFVLPKINFHTNNPVAYRRMQGILISIYRFYNQKKNAKNHKQK